MGRLVSGAAHLPPPPLCAVGGENESHKKGKRSVRWGLFCFFRCLWGCVFVIVCELTSSSVENQETSVCGGGDEDGAGVGGDDDESASVVVVAAASSATATTTTETTAAATAAV